MFPLTCGDRPCRSVWIQAGIVALIMACMLPIVWVVMPRYYVGTVVQNPVQPYLIQDVKRDASYLLYDIPAAFALTVVLHWVAFRTHTLFAPFFWVGLFLSFAFFFSIEWVPFFSESINSFSTWSVQQSIVFFSLISVALVGFGGWYSWELYRGVKELSRSEALIRLGLFAALFGTRLAMEQVFLKSIHVHHADAAWLVFLLMTNHRSNQIILGTFHGFILHTLGVYGLRATWEKPKRRVVYL